jgi:predicted transcriptional regulator
MSDQIRLGDLQLAIMQVLWLRGEASAADVHQALLEERGLAPTTIATMLKKMEAKGVVQHRTEGRKFIYSPTVTESQARRSMVAEITERLFAGDPAALVSHLLSHHEVAADEVEEIKERIARFERGEEA